MSLHRFFTVCEGIPSRNACGPRDDLIPSHLLLASFQRRQAPATTDGAIPLPSWHPHFYHIPGLAVKPMRSHYRSACPCRYVRVPGHGQAPGATLTAYDKMSSMYVTPAKAGVQNPPGDNWIPAFAGMTYEVRCVRLNFVGPNGFAGRGGAPLPPPH